MHQFAWKILGAVFKQTGRISESITYMHKSLLLNPLDAEAHNNYGVTLQELGRLEEAEASYTQAIKLEPNYIEMSDLSRPTPSPNLIPVSLNNAINHLKSSSYSLHSD